MRAMVSIASILLATVPLPLEGGEPSEGSRVCSDQSKPVEELEGRRPSKDGIAVLEVLLACLESGRPGSLWASADLSLEQLKALSNDLQEGRSVELKIAETRRKILSHNRFLEFAGASWGGGLVRSPGRRVTKAVVDSQGVVRATEVLQGEVRPVAVFTRLLGKGGSKPDRKRIGVGPLLVASPGAGSDKVPTSLGAGLMVGLRVNRRGSAVGIGLAYVIDGNLKSLHGDFRDGEPAPLDELQKPLQPRFVSETRGSWMVTVAFSPAKRSAN